MTAWRALVGTVLTAGLLGLVFWPTLTWLVASWLGNPYYSHGFLVPLVAAVLVWRRRSALAAPRPDNAGLALVAAGLGLVWTFWGRDALGRLAFPLVFLIVAIPVPWIERFSPFLEAFVARYATLAARAAGVAAINTGSQVSLAGTTFVVGAPCSGLRSLVTLVTLAVLLSYVVRGPAWARAVIVLAALPVALLANLVRVSSLFWVAGVFGPDAGLGYYHTLSSPVLFVIALGLLIGLSWGLRCSEIRTDI